MRTRLIALLLAAVLALTAALAWQAWVAARDRRAVAQAALRDYAAFGASEFGRRGRDALSNALLFGVLRPALGVNAAGPPSRLPPVAILEQAGGRPLPDLRPAVSTWFRIVLADGELTTARTPPGERVTRWLRDSVPPMARALQAENRYFGMLAGAPQGTPVVAGFLSRYGADGRVAVTYGFVMPAAALAPVFAAVLAGPPLLPRAGAPVPNDTALAVRVAGPGGAELFRAGTPVSDAAVESLGTQYGSLVAQVATRPEAASRFVIGGMPRPPVVPLAGALVLTAALLAVALLQLRREAELARLREDFVASVSHELRTPLAQIRLFAETLLLGRARSDTEQRRAVEIIESESRRLSHLVENLLQFSRAARPAGVLARDPVALAPLARDVADGLAPMAAARQATVTVGIDEDLEVRADHGALRQVLVNLLDNALKYGPAGQGVTVRGEASNRTVRITVDDQGPGVPEGDRGRVFERFVRLDGARGTTGAGLGLAVVRELARGMNGRVWAERAPGGGARFVVELGG